MTENFVTIDDEKNTQLTFLRGEILKIIPSVGKLLVQCIATSNTRYYAEHYQNAEVRNFIFEYPEPTNGPRGENTMILEIELKYITH